MNKPHLSELIFFWVLFAGAGYLAYSVLAPYVTPLFLGVVLAIVMRPMYHWLHIKLPGKPGIAAALTTLAAIFIVLVPLFFAALLLVNEVGSYDVSLHAGAQSISTMVDRLQEYVHRIAPSISFSFNPNVYVDRFTSFVASNIGGLASGIVVVGLDSILALVALYVFLREGHKLHAFALAWSPLPDRYDRSIISRIGGAVTAVVKGTLLTALAQGFLAGIGYAIFGAPSPTLWGVVTIFAALIPIVGTSIVTVPMAIVVGAQNGTILGVGLLLWGIIVVAGGDNFLRPLFIRGGLPIHPFLILLSVIGGISVFGPVGFIAGPVSLAFFFSLLELYPAVVQGKMDVLEKEEKIVD